MLPANFGQSTCEKGQSEFSVAEVVVVSIMKGKSHNHLYNLTFTKKGQKIRLSENEILHNTGCLMK